MNMKLSEKGLKRLIKNCVDKIPSPYSCGDGSEEPTYNLIVKKEWYHNRNKTSIKDYRFNQNDFNDVVILSIDEAIDIASRLGNLSELKQDKSTKEIEEKLLDKIVEAKNKS